MKLSRRSLLVSAAAVAAVPAAVLAAPLPEIIPTLGEFAAGYGYSAGQLAMIELRLLAAAERMVNRPWVMADDGTDSSRHTSIAWRKGEVATPRSMPGLWRTIDRNG